MSGLHIARTKETHIGKWIGSLIVLAVIGVAVFFGVRWYMTGVLPPFPFSEIVPATDPTANVAVVTDAQKADYKVQGTAIRSLTIESADVRDARVYEVDRSPVGLITPPANIHDVARYKRSALPGSDTGAVVLVGRHAGERAEGVFAKLGSVKQGDVIRVSNGNDRTYEYVVRDLRTYAFDDLNRSGMKELLSPVDTREQGLNIMTDAGNWIPRLGMYDQRLIVRATID